MKTGFRFKETILSVICDDGLGWVITDAVMEAREIIERKIDDDPFFGITYDPYPASSRDDPLICRMCDASCRAEVGPMAGVAGAVAVHTAERLVEAGSSKVVVENGGDIAFMSPEPMSVGIFADHPVFRDLAFIMRSDRITGICSSSRTVGHSVSLGSSSISTVFSGDVVLADCFATRLGNLVTDECGLEDAVKRVGTSEGVCGCMSCIGDRVAFFGDIPEMVSADCGEAESVYRGGRTLGA